MNKLSSKPLMVGLVMVVTAALGLGWATPDTYTYNFETKGRVAQFNAQAQTFVVNDYTVKVDAKTRYEYRDDSITASRFWSTNRSGSRVEVKGNRSGKTLTAVKIEVKVEGEE